MAWVVEMCLRHGSSGSFVGGAMLTHSGFDRLAHSGSIRRASHTRVLNASFS